MKTCLKQLYLFLPTSKTWRGLWLQLKYPSSLTSHQSKNNSGTFSHAVLWQEKGRCSCLWEICYCVKHCLLLRLLLAVFIKDWSGFAVGWKRSEEETRYQFWRVPCVDYHLRSSFCGVFKSDKYLHGMCERKVNACLLKSQTCLFRMRFFLSSVWIYEDWKCASGF